MALFGGKRGAIDQVLAGIWSSETERDALFGELRRHPPAATQVVQMVRHRDPQVRRLGTELFVADPDEEAVRALIDEMAGQPAQVQASLLPLLQRVPQSVLRKVLDPMVEDAAMETRQLGWEIALHLQGGLRLAYLEKAVRQATGGVRLKALRELVETRGAKRMVRPLLQLARDEDPRVALAALEALSTLDDPEIFGLMADRLARGDEASRRAAEAYLQNAARANPTQMRERMFELLTRGEDATRRVAVKLLLSTAHPEETVMEILHRSHGMLGWQRTRILEILRDTGEAVLRLAVKLMAHEDEEIRGAALMLAEGFDDPRLVQPFCQLLKDPDWWLRVNACGALGQLKNERAVPHLVAALKDDDTRWAAVDALAQIAAPAALQPLSQLLRDPRDEVRQEVIQAFSHFEDPRLLPVLKKVSTKDPSVEVRHRAKEVLRDLAIRLDVHAEGTDDNTRAIARQALTRPMDKLLARVRDMGASDLHLTVGEPPMVRLDGQLHRLEGAGPLSGERTRELVHSILDEAQRGALEEGGTLDFCYQVGELGRYRANAYLQQRGLCGSFRVIPNTPPTFADLGIPERLKEMLDYHQGIIVLSGPAGCGKSTTLAAVVNLINETRPLHLISLEDPIEFVHPPKVALVNQRQVGRDTESFARGLRGALRQDPDVIVVGEMRDTETIRMALEAAETGHLVVATLHTSSAVQTIDRLVDSFPAQEQAHVRVALSESLKFVVCQRLLPRKEGRGRVAAFEVLKSTMSIGNIIRKNETFQIPGLMQIGRRIGMRTLDQALAELVQADLIRPETAWEQADKPETFAPLCDAAWLAKQQEVAF